MTYLITQKIKLIKHIFIYLIIFAGCSTRDYSIKSLYIVTIKSPELKYSDLGTISKSGEDVAIELFAFGNKILDLKLEKLITINGNILPPSIFYSKYLKTDYPDETIKQIFLGQPIFNSKNLKKDDGGFEQRIDEFIFYKVSSQETLFRDSKKNITIKFIQK